MRKIHEKKIKMRERGLAGNALYHASCSISISTIFTFAWAIKCPPWRKGTESWSICWVLEHVRTEMSEWNWQKFTFIDVVNSSVNSHFYARETCDQRSTVVTNGKHTSQRVNLVTRVSHLTAPWSDRVGALKWETLGTKLAKGYLLICLAKGSSGEHVWGKLYWSLLMTRIPYTNNQTNITQQTTKHTKKQTKN